MGHLSTHVLDTTRGKPGVGIKLVVQRLHPDRRETVSTAITNDDGRCDSPLLEGGSVPRSILSGSTTTSKRQVLKVIVNVALEESSGQSTEAVSTMRRNTPMAFLPCRKICTGSNGKPTPH